MVRLHQRLITPPTLSAGNATMAQFLGDEEIRTDRTTVEDKITLRQAKGSSSFTQTQIANDGSQSQIAEREALKAARRDAEDTIHRQDIPAGYRSYLRKYFDGLQPQVEKVEDR